MSVDEWIDKVWHVNTMGSYLAIQRNKTLIRTRWLDPENITLSEKS